MDVPALGFSITANLEGSRQVVFQTHFPWDASDAEINDALDRILRISDRQKARYEIEGIETELADHREKLAQFEEDLARVDGDTDRKIAEIQIQVVEMKAHRPEAWEKVSGELDVEVLKLQEERRKIWNEGQEAFTRSGRHGVYAPRGAHQASIDRIDAALEGMKADKAKARESWDAQYDAVIATAEAEAHKMEQERAQAKQGLGISINRFKGAIAVREELLAKTRTLIDGS